MRLLGPFGSAEPGKVISGSATQDLWLGNGKVGSQVIGEDQSRLPGRKIAGKLEEEEKSATKWKRVHRFRIKCRREI